MTDFVYKNENAREVVFPLGGIGSGSVGLYGNGQLGDIEIWGRPNKGSHANLSHFAIKAENETEVLDARVCQGPYPGSRMGSFGRPRFNSYGFGTDRASMMGMPHFEDCELECRFPIAELRLSDKRFPGKVTMEAFNPFIPLKDLDSSLPAAFFKFTVENTTTETLKYTVGFSLCNLLSTTGGIHTYHETETGRAVLMKGVEHEENGLCIATDCMEGANQLYWYRGNWFDNLSVYWNDFSTFGRMKERTYDAPKVGGDPNYSAVDLGTLTAEVTVPAGEKRELRFVWGWYVPEMTNFWNPPKEEEHHHEDGEECDCGCDCCCGEPENKWRHYYATVFTGALDAAAYAIENFEALEKETKAFRDTLFGSTLPKEAIDAISANLSVLKSPTCLRLEDGSLYGFEGCHTDCGSCEGTCTHVWSYTYAVPFLFPALERSVRQNEYWYSVHDSGSMGFRLMLPLGREATSFRACCDGQFATVMRVWREFKVCGNLEWLKSLWPQIKKTIEFAWSEENYDRWDMNKDGVLEGRQHHTLDMELFGPNSWLTGMYLGALQAASKMAKLVGDWAAAEEYEKIYESGKEKLNNELYNGEYFIQNVDLKDRSILEPFNEGDTLVKGGAAYVYWNEENNEMKYQIGQGCALDQMLGQWHADLIGLDPIFDADKVDSALHAIYKNNFMERASDYVNPCRLFAMEDEQGLRICSWPKGVEKPLIGVPYNEESMHGFEYAAASHMIARGMEEEGLRCVRAVRDRYNGVYRNPFNEFECGSNYARSMASFALLLVYSGFDYDLFERRIGFKPLHPENFRALWSLDSGWGSVEYSDNAVTIALQDGCLTLQTVNVQMEGKTADKLLIDGREVAFSVKDGMVVSDAPFTARENIKVIFA